MDKKTFLKFLAMHGADFARWDGADVKAAAALMEGDETLKAAFENEMALDNLLSHFSVPSAAGAALHEKIITNVKAKKYADLEAPITAPSPLRALVMYGGGAFAVVAFLLVASLMLGSNLPDDAGEGTPIQVAYLDETSNNDSEPMPADILVSVEESAVAVLEEEIASQEMEMLWQLAQASIPQSNTHNTEGASEAEIESFINEIFDAPSSQPQTVPPQSIDPALEQEMDLWDLYLQSESATL